MPRLRRFARSLTGSVDLADDLVQAACERVLAQPQATAGVAKLDSWMFRVIHNEWVDEVRRSYRRSALPLEQGGDVCGEDVERSLIARSTLAQVRDLMEELPAEQRAVIMLVCVDGLRYQEAAEVLNVPIGTVMSRLCRARMFLAERLKLTEAGGPVAS